ncbi:DinB family protein [Paraburkholderia lacunae]|uniref:Damage-inducible protein DinB n=1 Tax=Paraburkholderia lacunae TaxID=2211104 RepID=A0A370NBX3_9BURK|nr:DinB family protein [Paraburkholderia lacunae]RDK03099.1 damage-inducible protein DinB [Paraburkholderia lacunae]
MSAQTLLSSLFRYKAWADEGLIAGLRDLAHDRHNGERDTATCIFSHAHIVDKIFAAHLQQVRHGYATTGTDDVPSLEELAQSIRETDQWYIAYVESLTSLEFSDTVEFVFTDGSLGRMSREEIFGHVIAHGGYHRGEVGRILTQLTASSPRDTFTGYLHEVDPARGGLMGRSTAL